MPLSSIGKPGCGFFDAFSTPECGSPVSKVTSQPVGSVMSGLSSITNSVGKMSELGGMAQNAAGLVNKVVNIAQGVTPVPGLDAIQGTLSGSAAMQSASVTSVVDIPENPPYQNVLHYYTSFNYIFTLSILSDNEYNFPDETYKQGNLGKIILSSGNADPENRIETAYGKQLFIIEDVHIDGLIGVENISGNTNATTLRFKVVEPYSMGLFFQTLQLAAVEKGHGTWNLAPFLLTLNFKGHINQDFQGYVPEQFSIERATKHIPIKISNITMNVNKAGATYDVSGYAYNEWAMSDVNVKMKSEVVIHGSSVVELLQTGENSLQAVVNRVLKEQVTNVSSASAIEPDQILILFPPDVASAATKNTDAFGTVSNDTARQKVLSKLSVEHNVNSDVIKQVANINIIGASNMGYGSIQSSDHPFAPDDLVFDPATGTYKRNNVVINPTKSAMKFPQDSNIQDIINNVILFSSYGINAVKAISNTGKVKFWRIHPQVYNISSNTNLPVTGRVPRLFVYRVVPYDYDASRFAPVNTVSPTIADIKKKIIKEYNYIYTGKNIDIIDFQLQFNPSFYQSLSADFGKNSSGSQMSSSTSAPSSTDGLVAGGIGVGSPGSIDGRTTIMADSTKTGQEGVGGSKFVSPATVTAINYKKLVENSVDMVMLELQIFGDPYFIGDSGIGNYDALPSNHSFINGDYSVDAQRGEVFVVINFRTPIDANMYKLGTYDFANTTVAADFSGVYKVTTIESSFVAGKFTQTLSLMRQPGQVGTPSSSNMSSLQEATMSRYGLVMNSEQSQILAKQDSDFFLDKYGLYTGSEQSQILAKQDSDFFLDKYGLYTGSEQSQILAKQDSDFE